MSNRSQTWSRPLLQPSPAIWQSASPGRRPQRVTRDHSGRILEPGQSAHTSVDPAVPLDYRTHQPAFMNQRLAFSTKHASQEPATTFYASLQHPKQPKAALDAVENCLKPLYQPTTNQEKLPSVLQQLEADRWETSRSRCVPKATSIPGSGRYLKESPSKAEASSQLAIRPIDHQSALLHTRSREHLAHTADSREASPITRSVGDDSTKNLSSEHAAGDNSGSTKTISEAVSESRGPLLLVKDFEHASIQETTALLELNHENVGIDVCIRTASGKDFHCIKRDVPLALLRTFSTVVKDLHSLGGLNGNRLLLDNVEASDVKVLLEWAYSACERTHLPPLPVDSMTCDEWMSIWKTSQIMEMPLALLALHRDFPKHLKSCNLEDTLACYIHALDFGLIVPTVKFHQRLYAFVREWIGPGLDMLTVDLLVRKCPNRDIVDVAIETLVENLINEPSFTSKHLQKRLRNASSDTKLAVVRKWEELETDEN